jgi:hypothetical protein
MIVLIAGPHKPPRSYQGLGLPYLGFLAQPLKKVYSSG